jgi:hypothetical protein
MRRARTWRKVQGSFSKYSFGITYIAIAVLEDHGMEFQRRASTTPIEESPTSLGVQRLALADL